MAWESDNHPWLMLAGKIGEKCSVGGFFFGAHGAPYRTTVGIMLLLSVCYALGPVVVICLQPGGQAHDD